MLEKIHRIPGPSEITCLGERCGERRKMGIEYYYRHPASPALCLVKIFLYLYLDKKFQLFSDMKCFIITKLLIYTYI